MAKSLGEVQIAANCWTNLRTEKMQLSTEMTRTLDELEEYLKTLLTTHEQQPPFPATYVGRDKQLFATLNPYLQQLRCNALSAAGIKYNWFSINDVLFISIDKKINTENICRIGTNS